MMLETFFERFDQFADAPNAVAKMRELVLQLAVQGKLVEQEPNDEPANILLERIKKSKARLINERAIKRQDTELIFDDEAPFSIPSSWIWTRLGEIGDWGSGSTPARGNYELYDGGIMWLKSGELNNNQALAGSEETVSELALKTGSFRRNQPGDILLAMYGATIGKVAILAKPAVTNQAVCGCTPFEGVLNRYLFNYLISQRANFHSASEGGAQPNISKVKIISFPFPLSPFAEQKRIVAKVDELMAMCDRLEAQQEERETRHAALARASLARFADAPSPANLNLLFRDSCTIEPADFRKTILTLAVQGKFVSQDPNDEEHDVPGIGSTGLDSGTIQDIPYDVPESWLWVRLGHVAQFINGDRSKNYPSRSFRVDQGVPFINAGHLVDGDVALTNMDYITEERFRLLGSGKIERGDVLYCLRGSLGKSAVVQSVDRGAIASSLLIIRPSGRALARFIYFYLRSELGTLMISKYDNGSAQPNLSATNVKQYLMPLPPLDEQRRIVTKVDQLMVLVDRLETQLAESHTTGAALMEAAVAELSA